MMRCVYVLLGGIAALAGCAADSPYTSGNLANYPRSDVALAGISASTITRNRFAKLGPGVNYIAFAKQGEGVHGPLAVSYTHLTLPTIYSV